MFFIRWCTTQLVVSTGVRAGPSRSAHSLGAYTAENDFMNVCFEHVLNSVLPSPLNHVRHCHACNKEPQFLFCFYLIASLHTRNSFLFIVIHKFLWMKISSCVSNISNIIFCFLSKPYFWVLCTHNVFISILSTKTQLHTWMIANMLKKV